MQARNGGPYAIGGAIWPGLSKLIEEAGEVQQVAGKIIGTGGNPAHWDGTDLRERMRDELADLMAACVFVAEVNDLDGVALEARSAQKLALFREWHAAK